MTVQKNNFIVVGWEQALKFFLIFRLYMIFFGGQ